MPSDTRFRDALLEVVRGMRQSEIVARTGISSAYVNALITKGRVPSREKLAQLADGLDLGDLQRARLFASAGYVDGTITSAPGRWPPRVQRVAEVLCRLRDEELEAIERTAELLAARRVIEGAVYA